MRHVERTERVVVLALDGVYPFELGIPSRILGAADGRYEVLTCTVDGRPVRTNADFTIGVEHGPEILATADTVVITPVSPERMPAELPEEVRQALAYVRPDARIVSIFTGAFILAAAGLLDGRRATPHWQLAGQFRRMFPHIDLDPDVLFVDDGSILTSAGAASGVDICLHLASEGPREATPQPRGPAAVWSRRSGTAARPSTSSSRSRNRA